MKLGKKHQRQYLLHKWAKRYLPKAMPPLSGQQSRFSVDKLLDDKTRRALRLQLVTNRAIQAYFDLDTVRQLLNAAKPTEEQLRLILALTQFAIWHRLFVENEAKQPPSAQEDFLDWL